MPTAHITRKVPIVDKHHFEWPRLVELIARYWLHAELHACNGRLIFKLNERRVIRIIHSCAPIREDWMRIKANKYKMRRMSKEQLQVLLIKMVH